MRTTILLLAAALAAIGRADTVVARWGGKGTKCAFPDTLKVVSGKVPRLVFDLSAIPRGTKVHRASLYCFTNGQPREPIEILAEHGQDGAAGKPLTLVAPWFRSLDATAAVRAWVAEPARNAGFAFVRFEGNPARSFLEVCYEGKSLANAPPQVDALKVIHHDGQTFLTFQELPAFRPAADKVLWIDDYADADKCVAKEPGTGVMGYPRVPGLRLDVLRDLQGLEVRTTPGKGQEEPPFKRTRELPDVAYRIYRSDKPITNDSLKDALLVGEAEPLNAYDFRMLKIYSQGEYYNKHERPDNVIGTFCVADHQGVLPGHAFYVHTPASDGKAYYAVTVMQDGVESTAISAANATPQPVAEKAQLPKPLEYHSVRTKLRGRHDPATVHEFLFWVAPPFANLPDNHPRHIGVAIADDYKAPGPLLINLGRAWAEQPGSIMLAIAPAGDLCYNDGVGTLRSYRESRLDYFPERYFFHLVQWALARWQVDPAQISGTKGMSLHLAIRHPELFKVYWPDRPEFFQNDFDTKWNPAGWLLPSKVGPHELVRAPDGSPGWNIFDMAWYLRQNPGKDIPFMGCLFSQPKDGNHGAEYGWQDDPKGWAALRDARQPFVAQWGGARIADELRNGLFKLRWDRSVPAFSNCSLDNSPGNGDPDEGEPWGQINGYLFWDYESVADQPDRWEMTVYLVAAAPAEACTVDLTPRHRKAFHPKPGANLRWSNTDLASGQAVQSGTLAADKWGLATLQGVQVSKGKNRVRIELQGSSAP